MQVVDGLVAVLAVDVRRDVVHGAGAIERHHGDDVFETVGLEALQALAHARTFELEHTGRIGPGEKLVALLVIDGERGEVELDAVPALDELQRLLDDGQRLEAEEVELHEAGRLDELPVELRDRHVRARITIDGHELVERAVADHHAGGVRRGVAVEAFELLRDFEQARDDGLAVALLLQLGLAGNGIGERNRIGRIVRNELAEAVDLAVRHLQHASDVAQHGARLQLSVRDDLRDAIVAVFLLDVADDLVAPVLAEVDVEVRHRDALGIEKALEEQAEAEWIEIGDGKRPGDERAGARAATRSDGNAVRLGPFDEVRNDQEVARELHALDDVDLVGEALLVVLLGEAGRERIDGEPLDEAFLRLTRELGGLGFGALFGGRVGFGLHEVRQDGFAPARAIGAAARDLDGAGEGLGQIGEHLGHGLGALEVVLGREAAAVVLIEVAAFRNAEQCVVGLVVLGLGEVALVGRDERQILGVGEIDELRLDGFLLGEAVALKLDIEAVAEDVLERLHARGCGRAVIVGNGLVDRAVGAAGECDQAFGVGGNVADLGVRRLAIARTHVGAARDLHEIAVAGLAHGEQCQQAIAMRGRQGGQTRDAGAGFVRFLEIDGEADAHDRLDARAGELVGEFEGAEEVVRVGERKGRKAELGRALGERADRQRAFEQRIGRMHLEVHERGRAGGGGNRLGHARRLLHRATPTNAAKACGQERWRRRKTDAKRIEGPAVPAPRAGDSLKMPLSAPGRGGAVHALGAFGR